MAACACQRASAPAAKKEDGGPVPVRVARVETRQIQREVESVGSLFPFEEVTISSEIDGRVAEVTADLGDRVVQNQVLVRISEEEERFKLAGDEAQLRQALEKLGLRNENDRIEDINQASEVRRARADLFDAEQRYKRVRDLVDQGIGSRQDLDEAQARYQAELLGAHAVPGRGGLRAAPGWQPDSGGGTLPGGGPVAA